MASNQNIQKASTSGKKESLTGARNDIQGILNQLSNEISKLETENTSLKSTIENLITKDPVKPTSGKVTGTERKLSGEEQLRRLLAENIQLKNNLLILNLTTKEKQVLQLIANGLTNNEIAKKLGRSHHTIISHRKSLLSKLKLNNTAALIQFAAKNGLI